jgi:hypothetical protein
MRHDIAYRNGDRCEADETMLHELNELDNRDLSCSELLAKYCALLAIGIFVSFECAIAREMNAIENKRSCFFLIFFFRIY